MPFAVGNLGCSGEEDRLLDCPGADDVPIISRGIFPEDYGFYDPNPGTCDPFSGTYAFVACGTETARGVADDRMRCRPRPNSEPPGTSTSQNTSQPPHPGNPTLTRTHMHTRMHTSTAHAPPPPLLAAAYDAGMHGRRHTRQHTCSWPGPRMPAPASVVEWCASAPRALLPAFCARAACNGGVDVNESACMHMLRNYQQQQGRHLPGQVQGPRAI